MSFSEDSQIDFSGFKPQELIELSYVSKATSDVGILGLMNLLEDAVHKNKKMGLTGVLFYDNGVYGQILEGYPQFVEPVWKSICADLRHKDIKILDIDKLAKRRFSNWSMKFYGSEEISKYVPELKMGFKEAPHTLPREILTLMRSVGQESSNSGGQNSSELRP
jgi:hypothetical protein